MQKQDIETILASQRKFFATGKTLPVPWRLEQLKKLRTSMLRHEEDLYGALKKDLGKSRMESYMCEIGLTLSELTWMEKHIRRLTREKRVPTPLAQFAARSFQSPTPYGTVLIMSPWNYPVLLTLEPLIDALAGGKTVGREVLRHAAEYLTPVTLELGGKSPCIVDSTAKIPLAARRIVFGKYLNCGQTCVAPDYILCDVSIKDALLAAIQKEITRQFGDRPLDNPDYGKIINEKHFERILGLIAKEKIICGGESDSSTLRIAPTVLTDVSWDDPVMGEEIFGPLLPVLTYSSLDEAIRTVESHPHPLALYFFSEDKKAQKKVLDLCHFGGGCINDTIIHLATSAMPFGGVGESGMGGYHGMEGFKTFSHTRSIVDKKTWMDLPIRYQEYVGWKEKLLRMFLR